MTPNLIVGWERWKWSKEYGMYVSNYGHFRGADKKPIKQKVTHGYLTVPTKYGSSLAHRIVMRTWRPTEDMEHLTVDHLDHNTRNNRVDNLEWVTKEENLRRAEEDCEDNKGTILAAVAERSGGPAEPIGAAGSKKFVAIKNGAVGSGTSFLLLADAAKWIKVHEKSLGNAGYAAIEKGINHSVQSGLPYATWVWRYE